MNKYASVKVIIPVIAICAICFALLAINTNNNHHYTTKTYSVSASLSPDVRDLPYYGFNGQIEGGQEWTNQAFCDSVASLHLKLIRYPGGTVANFWDWQNGGFENKPVLGRPNPHPKLRHTADGLNELKLLVDKAHCDVVFVLNMTSRTVDDQIEMLQKAQSIGIPVKWVELGNEFNIKESIGRLVYHTPNDYAITCKKWITEIKMNFPGARVAVIGGNLNYKFANVDVSDWNKDVLYNVPNADAIVAHIYPLPKAFMDGNDINFEKLYNDCIEKYNNRGYNLIDNNTKIWITEYNIHWDKMADLTNVTSWGQALSIMLLTSTLTNRSNNVQMLLNHNITSPQFGAIDGRHNNFNKLPNGIAMEQWLRAGDNMDALDQLVITDGQKIVKDYDLFGWKFLNKTNNKSDLVLVNLTGGDVNFDLSKIPDKYSTFEAKYSDNINAPLDNKNPLKAISGNIVNNLIKLEKYSITTVSN